MTLSDWSLFVLLWCHAANPMLCDSMHHVLLNCYKEYSLQFWGWYAVQAWQRLSTTNRVQLS